MIIPASNMSPAIKIAFLLPVFTEKEETNGENSAKAIRGMVVIKPAWTLFICRLSLMNLMIGPTEVMVVLRLHATNMMLIISSGYKKTPITALRSN